MTNDMLRAAREASGVVQPLPGDRNELISYLDAHPELYKIVRGAVRQDKWQVANADFVREQKARIERVLTNAYFVQQQKVRLEELMEDVKGILRGENQ